MTILINTTYSIQGNSFEDTFVHTMHKNSLYTNLYLYIYVYKLNIRFMFAWIQAYHFVPGIIPMVR